MTKSEAIALFGTTQGELADALGVSQSFVSKWPEEEIPRRWYLEIQDMLRSRKPARGDRSSPRSARA